MVKRSPDETARLTGTQSIERALLLLREIAAHNRAGSRLLDLATQTKLSVSQISAIERGTNLPSIESLLAISRAFDKKPSEILEGIDF